MQKQLTQGQEVQLVGEDSERQPGSEGFVDRVRQDA